MSVAVEVPVTRVTVLEDRASVRRQRTLDLPAGHHRLRVEGLAPVLVDKSLSATGEGLKVAHAEVRRELVHRSVDVADERVVALRDEERAQRRALEAMDHRGQAIEAENATLSLALVRLLEEVGEDAAWGREAGDCWRADFEALESRLEQSGSELADLHHRRKLLAREVADLARRIAELTSPSTRRRCWLELDLHVERADAQLQIDYLVPSAAWRPVHRATLTDDGATVRFETEACVWQRTGEDWSDVELRVSTERISAGAEPPSLASDTLRVRPKDSQVRVEMREREVEQIGPGGGPRMARATEVPGVDDGGSAILRTVEGPVSIPSDGRPHRAPLGGFESAAEVGFVCVPELESAVVLRTRLENRGDQAILAGPVELFRDAGPAGRARVLYVATGERFDLGWGPEPSLRVHREVEIAPPESGVLSRWIATGHHVEVRVGHLGLQDVAYDVELVERVPVSELEAVRVEVDEERTTQGVRPDDDGFVRWTRRVAPGDRWKVELRWTLAKKKDVVGV